MVRRLGLGDAAFIAYRPPLLTGENGWFASSPWPWHGAVDSSAIPRVRARDAGARSISHGARSGATSTDGARVVGGVEEQVVGE